MNELYTVKDISLLLNVDARTIRRWIRTGKLNGIKTSKKTGFIIQKDDLLDFCNQNPKYRLNMPAQVKEEFVRTQSQNNFDNSLDEVKKTILQIRTQLNKLEKILNSL